MTWKANEEMEEREILREFADSRRWLPRNFAERAEIISYNHQNCLRKITRYIKVNEIRESLELSEVEYHNKIDKLRKDFEARDDHNPDNYIEDIDRYLIPETHDTGTCTRCSGKMEVDCPKCNSSGNIKCPDCDGKGEISKKEPCKKCDGTGEVNSEDCSRCQGNGEDVVTVACTRCGTEGIITCDRCSGNGEITCPKCDGKGMTHGIKVLKRNYRPKEQVEYENCIAPNKLIEDIQGTHSETTKETSTDSKLKREIERRKLEIHKIEYKFPRRLLGNSDTVWEAYKIENSYRCENFPSILNPIYL